MEVLVVHEEAPLRQALGQIVESAWPEAAVAGEASLAEALSHAPEKTGEGFDLILIDWSAIDRHGPQGLVSLRDRYPSASLLPLSFANEAAARMALAAAVVGIVASSGSGAILLGALRVVFNTTSAPTEPRPERQSLELAGSFPTLTRRERDVLELLVAGHGNKTIAAALDRQEATVKAHLNRLYRKIGARNRAHAVSIALNMGVRPSTKKPH